jgi:hypothetical protein
MPAPHQLLAIQHDDVDAKRWIRVGADHQQVHRRPGGVTSSHQRCSGIVGWAIRVIENQFWVHRSFANHLARRTVLEQGLEDLSEVR